MRQPARKRSGGNSNGLRSCVAISCRHVQLRTLGRSGLKVSAIGLGGNTFGRTVDSEEAIAVIRRALDLGITFVDTADVYAFGRSEELVGQALAGRRTEVVLATKCGMAMDD